MAKIKHTRLSATTYRDARGRIQSYAKISPKNNPRRIEGKEIQNKFVSVKVTATKEKVIDEVTGKPRIKVTRKEEYFFDFGKKATKRDLQRYQNGLKIEAEQKGTRQITEEKTFLGFSIIAEINNRLEAGEATFYKEKLITAQNYTQIINEIRKKIKGKPKKDEKGKISSEPQKLFGMNFFTDDTAEIFEATTEEEETAEEDQEEIEPK